LIRANDKLRTIMIGRHEARVVLATVGADWRTVDQRSALELIRLHGYQFVTVPADVGDPPRVLVAADLLRTEDERTIRRIMRRGAR